MLRPRCHQARAARCAGGDEGRARAATTLNPAPTLTLALAHGSRRPSLAHPLTTPLQVAWAVNLAAACGCLGSKGASAEATERQREAKGKAGKAAVKYMVSRDKNWTL